MAKEKELDPTPQARECPKCEKQIPADSETCPACNLNLANYDSLTEHLDVWHAARDRKKAKESPPAPPKPKSIFDNLKGGKR